MERYYIGCRIPRAADCDDGHRCIDGVYCNALEVLSVSREDLQKGYVRSFRYGGKACIFFDSKEEAEEYLKKISK